MFLSSLLQSLRLLVVAVAPVFYVCGGVSLLLPVVINVIVGGGSSVISDISSSGCDTDSSSGCDGGAVSLVAVLLPGVSVLSSSGVVLWRSLSMAAAMMGV